MVCQLNRELGTQMFSVCYIICHSCEYNCQSQWSGSLRRGSVGRSPADITESNPAKGLDVCLL